MNRIRVLVQAIVMIGILTSCDSCDDEALNGTFTLSNGKTVTLEGVASAGERDTILNALGNMSGDRYNTVMGRNITIRVETLSANFKVYAGSPCTLLGINRAYISNANFALSLEDKLIGDMYNNTVGKAITPAAIANGLFAIANDPTAIANGPTAIANDPTAIANDPAAIANGPAAIANSPFAIANSPAAIANG
jgi:hypothetical protein